MHHQPVGGDQHHLEEDEEVEKVAREKSAINPHELELEERVKMRPGPVPGRERLQQEHGSQTGSEQHQGHRQAIGHQRDAVGYRPVPQPIDEDFALAHRGEE